MSPLQAGPARVLEVGCGAGNTVLPVLAGNKNASLSLHACDFSPRAVQLVQACATCTCAPLNDVLILSIMQSHELYSSPPAGTISASVWDLTSDNLPEGIDPGSVDIVVLIFVLSALQPSEWAQAVRNMHTVSAPPIA